MVSMIPEQNYRRINTHHPTDGERIESYSHWLTGSA
jgi:hypothetical protein